MATSKIKSDSIDSIDAVKITTGTVDNARITLDAAEVPNLDASKITTGSIADARVPASAVTQHVTATDLSPLENDFAILALHQAINENKSAHNLANTFIEQFEDSNSITLTNCVRTSSEFVGSMVDDITTPSTSSDWVGSTSAFTISSGQVQQTTGDKSMRSVWTSGTGNFQIDFTATRGLNSGNDGGVYGVFPVSEVGNFNSSDQDCGMDSMTNSYYYEDSGGNPEKYWRGNSAVTSSLPIADGSVIKMTRISGELKAYDDGVLKHTWSTTNNTSMYFTIGGAGHSANVLNFNGISLTSTASANATGSFTSTTITPQDSASKNSLGLVLLYKNNAGTNTLNTDIVAKVSADNGSNYSTCVLASKGTFSTGINIAIAPAISVTAGTQLKYKIEFANQASGSKEGQIHGVALQY
jgi:hypothetical protein